MYSTKTFPLSSIVSPQTPIIFSLSPSLSARATNHAGTANPARHHSSHCRSQYHRSAAVGHLAGNPGPVMTPDNPLRNHRQPENPENSTKISFP
jgi:hypothetical protein